MVALVIAEPGRLRDAWRALLVAVPGIVEVHMADDAPAAMQLVAARRPTLVLIDGELRDESAPALVSQIKRLQPGARCIVLACCTGQEWPHAQVEADAILVKGFPAARLFDTISRVLADA